jgi:hypothetical protein
MWQFMALDNSIFERCDDSSGAVIGVFYAVCRDLGKIALARRLIRTNSLDAFSMRSAKMTMGSTTS